MFDIGFSELALIFVIGLVVLGPERLPKAARTLGYWMGRAKSTFNNLRNELEREALNQEMQQRMEKEMRDMGLDEDSIRQARDSLLSPEETARARQRDARHERDGHDSRLIEHDDGATSGTGMSETGTSETGMSETNDAPDTTSDHPADPTRPEKRHDA